jgi:hypothetical protein
MRRTLARPRTQLVLELELEPSPAEPPIAPGSKALLEALADLLLEALGRGETKDGGQEGGDESQDHA